MNIHEEKKQLESDMANAIRFADADGGIHQGADIYKRKVHALEGTIKCLKVIQGEKLKTEGVEDQGIIDDSQLHWYKGELEIINHEEELISAKKVFMQYEDRLDEWREWFEEKVMDCEKNFEETFKIASYITDNVMLLGAISKWVNDKDQTQASKIEFYLILKIEILKYREKFNRLPQPPKEQKV